MPAESRANNSTWSPFRNPIFRALWIANAFSNVGSWMQNTAMAWLMTMLAPSALMVSLVQVAATFPMFLLALPAGALADVIDRRRVIILTQLWMLLSAALLGVLTILNYTTPTILLLLVLSLGIGMALNAPAWQAVIPELVPREQIPAAVALNSAGFNLARSVGPALGGFVLVLLGAGPTFLINAVSFLGVVGVLLFWKKPSRESALPAERMMGAMRTGIRYVRHAPALKAVFARALVFVVFASSQMALLPLFARSYLHAGSGEYGLLLGAFGLGAVAGALMLPWIMKISLEALTIVMNIVFAVSLSFLALIHSFVPDFIAIFFSGIAWLVLLANFNSNVQSIVPAWVRGRCLAVYMLIFFGGMAIGSFLWGVAGNLFGIPAAFNISAAGMILGLPATMKLKMASADRIDLTPSGHWSMPAVMFEPGPDEGPVLVRVEYRIDPAKWNEFGRAMRRLRRARLRGGAFRWALFADLSEPGKYTETFLIESWLEHLRQHERLTVADREIETIVRAFHIGDTKPEVSHLLARPLPPEK